MGVCKSCNKVVDDSKMEDRVCEECRGIIDTTLNVTNNEVTVTDIKIPFFSMVIFMVKWVIASIPAFIILFVLGTMLTGVLGGIIGSRPY